MHRNLTIVVGLVGVLSLNASGQQAARSVTSAAAAPRTTSAGAVRVIDPRSLPGTSDSVLSTIQGNALDSANIAMPDTVVRLRDARAGRIADTQVTDRSGMFTFRSVEPGTYVVEIVGTDQTILAASQLLSVNAGDALSAIVKLPFRVSPFAGFFGHTAQSAAVVAAVAASAEVLAIQATKCVSPPCDQ